MTLMVDSDRAAQRVLALCGGVGGAKLARGLDRALPPGALTVVVNTGDDFEHLGLPVWPDVDTLLYTLAGLHDRERGWGRAGETWSFMEALEALGGETWFRLGDRDLATHVFRREALREGTTASAVTAELAGAFGIRSTVLPMSDAPVRTMVRTDDGELPFQQYFVRRRCEPVVRGLRFEGADEAAPAPGVAAAIGSERTAAIVICPSNPYLSVDPILAVPGMRAQLEAAAAPVVAVSPLIGGAAVKGPTAKIMRELGVAATSASIAEHYRGLIDGLVVDRTDAAEAEAIEQLGIRVCVTDTLMGDDDDDRCRLAETTLAFSADCGSRRGLAS